MRTVEGPCDSDSHMNTHRVVFMGAAAGALLGLVVGDHETETELRVTSTQNRPDAVNLEKRLPVGRR